MLLFIRVHNESWSYLRHIRQRLWPTGDAVEWVPLQGAVRVMPRRCPKVADSADVIAHVMKQTCAELARNGRHQASNFVEPIARHEQHRVSHTRVQEARRGSPIGEPAVRVTERHHQVTSRWCKRDWPPEDEIGSQDQYGVPRRKAACSINKPRETLPKRIHLIMWESQCLLHSKRRHAVSNLRIPAAQTSFSDGLVLCNNGSEDRDGAPAGAQSRQHDMPLDRRECIHLLVKIAIRPARMDGTNTKRFALEEDCQTLTSAFARL